MAKQDISILESIYGIQPSFSNNNNNNNDDDDNNNNNNDINSSDKNCLINLYSEKCENYPESIISSPYPSPSFYGMVHTGTSIIGLTYSDGIILGADSRSSLGGTYVGNRISDKLQQITDNIFICRSGATAHTQNFGDYCSYYLKNQQIELDEHVRVRTAARIFSQMIYNNKNWAQAEIIVAGYDKYEKGSIYSCAMGGTMSKQPFVIGGSGSAYIYGFIDEHYKQNMTKQETKNLAINALSRAVFRDSNSGGIIRLLTMTKDGVEREAMLPIKQQNSQ